MGVGNEYSSFVWLRWWTCNDRKDLCFLPCVFGTDAGILEIWRLYCCHVILEKWMVEKWSNVIIFFLMAYSILFSLQFGRELRWKTPIILIFFPFYFHSNQTMRNYIFLFIVLPSYFILFLSTPPKLDPWIRWVAFS